MAKDFTVKATIVAEDKATPVVTGVSRSLASLSNVIEGAVIGAAAGFTQMLVSNLVPALTAFTDAARESEDASTALGNALADVGPGSTRITQSLLDQAGALQQVTRFSDEAIVRGQTFAAAFIKNEDVLKKVTVAATDMATGLGVDLLTAFELLTKASQGHTETLARYGIIIDENIPKSEKFAAVLAQVAERFSGRAIADARTYSGEVTKLGNAFGEVEEALGRVITSSSAATQTMADLATVLNGVAAGINSGAQDTSAFADQIARSQEMILRFGGTLGNLIVTYRNLAAARAEAAKEAAKEEEIDKRNLAAKLEMQHQAAEIALAQELQSRNISTLTAALGSEAAAWEALNASLSRSSRINAEVAASQQSLVEAARDLGITLTSEANAALDRHRAALEAINVAYRQGIATASDVAAAEEALARIVAGSAVPAIEAHTTATDNGASSARTYADVLDTVVSPALQRTAAQAQATAAEVSVLSGVLDRSGNELPAGGTLSMGGTRYELPGGGSRLVGSSSLGGVSRNAFKVKPNLGGGIRDVSRMTYYVTSSGRVVPLTATEINYTAAFTTNVG
mgnify:CR=1 FL=1